MKGWREERKDERMEGRRKEGKDERMEGKNGEMKENEGNYNREKKIEGRKKG